MDKEVPLRHRNWIIAIACPEGDTGSWDCRRAAAMAAVEAQDRAALAAAGARLLCVDEEVRAALGGTLLRDIVGNWSWSDGAPEPRVRDLLLRGTWPNYRCRRGPEGPTVVEVLESDLRGDTGLARDLAWCRGAAVGRTLSGDHTGMRVLHAGGRITRAYADPATGETTGARAIPGVLLVPLEEWARRSLRACGARWDAADQGAILERARALGWDGE